MVLSEFNLKQRRIGLKKYIEIYGIELLNKIAREKKGVDILEMTSIDLGNLKKTLDSKGFKDFIIANKRLPNPSEATSLGHKFSEVRAAEKLKNPPKIPADTSPVYNKAEGYIYKRGGGGGNKGQVVYAKTKLGNQYTKVNPIRSVEEVQKIIDNAPELEINGKFFKQNPKDLTGTSVRSGKELITVRESQLPGLKFPATGTKKVEDPTQGAKNREKKIKAAQGSEISITRGQEIRKNFGHVYPIIASAKPGSKTTNLIDSTKNNKLIGFNKIGQKIAEDQEWYIKNKPKNYIEEIEKLNGKAKLNVKNAIEKLGPEYKGDIGYFQVDPNTGEFKPKAGNYKNSFAGIAGKNEIYYDMTSAERTQFGKKISDNALKTAAVKLAKNNTGNICDLVTQNVAGGGRIGFAKGGNCATQVAAKFDENPVKFAQDVNKLPEASGAINKVKSAASKFLNVAKKDYNLMGKYGKFGAAAALGAAATGVKEFLSDDPSTYLSSEGQQKNLLIDMVTEPIAEPIEKPKILEAQMPVLGAALVAGTIPGAKDTYLDAITGRGPKGPAGSGLPANIVNKPVGKFRATLGINKGVLGKGLAAIGTPAGMLATEPFFLGNQIAEGKSFGEIATNPMNYLGAAFASPLTKMATKNVSPTMANIMRLGLSPARLAVLSRFGQFGLAAGLGIAGVNLFNDYRNNKGFFEKDNVGPVNFGRSQQGLGGINFEQK